jgi:hypothetical protein
MFDRKNRNHNYEEALRSKEDRRLTVVKMAIENILKMNLIDIGRDEDNEEARRAQEDR